MAVCFGKYRPGRSWLPSIAAAVVIVLTWFLYRPSLGNDFTNWDDPAYVLDNAQVRQLGVQNAGYFFTHASAINYHPLTMLSLSLDYYLTTHDKRLFREADQLEAVVFHTTSLVIHLLNVLLVFVFCYLLSRKRLIVATVTALLFAIHPMHVQSVAWIAERKDVLYAFFFLAGLIGYLYYLERQAWRRLLVVGLLFSGSLLSKPSAVVFPLVLLAIDYFHGRAFTRRVLFEKIPFFILAVVFGAITFVIQVPPAAAELPDFTIAQRIMFAAYGFVMYQYKLLLPLTLSAYYPFPAVDSTGHLPVIYYLSLPIAGAIIGLVYLSTRFTRVVAFGYLFYFFSLMLVLQFIPVGSAIMADRYTYLSATGLFFIVAWYLDRAVSGSGGLVRSGRWLPAGAFLAAALLLGKAAAGQLKVWKNSETLWSAVIAHYPRDATAYKNRGSYYGALNRPDLALRDYLAFLRIRQDDPGMYRNLGNIYGLLNETDKALAAYAKSIALDSREARTYLNRAATYTRAKQYAPALEDYDTALKLAPGLIEIPANRAYTFLALGRYEDAIADFTRLIRHFPRNDIYLMDRGLCHYQLRHYPEALADFRQRIALDPANGRTYFIIATIYNELKDYRQAYRYAAKAESLDYPVEKTFLEELKAKGRP